jgi:hypothetical protein
VVQTINPQPAIITLKTRQIGAMRAIYLGPSCLVESECKAGTWYVVEDGRCTCPSGVYRGKCKHVAVAETAAQIEERESVPVQPEYVDVSVPNANGLVWAGYRRGWVEPAAL